MRKSCPGDPGHPLPQGKFTARLHGKKLPRVTESKLALSFARLWRVSKNVRPSFHSCCWLLVFSSMLLYRVKHNLCSMYSELALPPESMCVYVEKLKLARHPGVPYLVNRVTLSPSSPREVVIWSCKRSLRFIKKRMNSWRAQTRVPGTTFPI